MNKVSSKRVLLGAAAAGVLSLGATLPAHAVDMTVTATVQNTLTAAVVSELSFGQLFVTQALPAASSSGVRAPGTAGTAALTGIAVGTGMTFMSLGGSTRGEVSVAIPANSTTPYNVTLSGLTDSVKTADDCGAATSDGVLQLVHDSGNPAVPKFNVHTWTLGAGTGTTTVTPVVPTGTDGTAKGTVTPAFGAGPSVFNLGATISTECVTAAAPYQDTGTYVGTLTIEVGY